LASVVVGGVFDPSDTFSPLQIVPTATDGTGAFTSPGIINFCFSRSNTGVEVTATDALGVTDTEFFTLSCS
jgi:hypothetical protein